MEPPSKTQTSVTPKTVGGEFPKEKGDWSGGTKGPVASHPPPSQSVYNRKAQSDLTERHSRAVAGGNQLEVPTDAHDMRRHSASDFGKTSKVVAQPIPEYQVVTSQTEQEAVTGHNNEPRKSSAHKKTG